jgi:predicted nucleic acid-binding protein
VRIFLDTSVLVASVVKQHRDHERSFALLDRVQSGRDKGVISAHSLAESYATLTKLPPPFRHSPEQALLSIEENILKHFQTAELSGQDYAAILREAAAARIQGGTIYDAVLLKSAAQANADKIFTLNLRHFQAVAPPELLRIISLP